MKRILIKAAAVVTTVCMLTGLLFASPVSASMIISAQEDEQDGDTGRLALNGYGSIKVAPDMAMANIGVELTAKTASEAQELVAKVMDNVLKALRDCGIDAKDIQTNNYYMYQQYDYTPTIIYRDVMPSADAAAEEKEPNYTVIHALSVTIRDMEKVGEVIEAATAAGANQTSGVSFDVSNRSEVYIQALILAIKDAQLKADTLAKGFGVELGMPTTVSEGYNYSAARYSFASSDMAYRGEGSVQLEAGEIEITADVTVTYSYELK